MDFKPAICPNCGGELHVPVEKDIVTCMYCKTDVVVREAIQKAIKVIQHVDAENLLELAQSSLDIGNSEEARSLCVRILEQDAKNAQAWYIRGLAAMDHSSTTSFNHQELVYCIRKAISCANDGDKDTIKRKSMQAIADGCRTELRMWRNLLKREERYRRAKLWDKHLCICQNMMWALQQMIDILPPNVELNEAIAYICADNLEGVSVSEFGESETKHLGAGSKRDKELLKFYDQHIGQIKALNSSYQPPKEIMINGASRWQLENCFVVTAVMGDPEHEIVQLLRRFREEHLAVTIWGGWLIRGYRIIGPVFASLIQKHRFLRLPAYTCIVLPIYAFARLSLLHWPTLKK